MRMLQQGDPNGSAWRPGETDVSIRPGWFHHAAEDARVKSVDDLVGLYFTSVGRNSKLLLNVPPTRSGLLSDVDVSRLAGLRSRLDSIFDRDIATGVRTFWSAADRTLNVDLGRTMRFSIADLREDVSGGQTVSSYLLEREGARGLVPVCEGTTIGFRKLERFAAVEAQRLRLTIRDAVDAPRGISLGLFP
jgi:alpha-L-fucosidase